ncbi:MAG: hypothetical protein OXD36_00285 [Rhodobacter sp.]|nr:hypothetical protein [Rhodobacter sp.]
MRISKLLMPAVTLAGALALAGCGGGSSTPANTGGGGGSLSIAAGGERTENGTVYRCTKTTGTCPFTRDAKGDIVVAEDSGIEANPVKPPEPTPDTSDSNADVANKLRDANAALVTLSGDADDDDSALKRANDHHKDAANVIKAQGVSSAIAASAQGVLDARKALVDAVEDAKDERSAAKARVETLDDGATKKGLNDLIEAADKAIKAGEDLLKAKGRNSLQGLVAQYTGKDNTPAEKAETIAKALNDDALEVEDAIQVATRRPLALTDGAVGTLAAFITANDHDDKIVFATDSTRNKGSTQKFSEIFEGSTEQIAVSGEVVTGISLEGADLAAEGTEADLIGSDLSAGTRATPANSRMYLGITGNVYCRASSCAGVEAGDKVSEGWYFVPVSQDAYFAPDGKGGYEQASFVEWGMWLSGTTASAPNIERYVGVGRGSAALGTDSSADNFDVATPATTANKLAAIATYTGGAAGLSTRETGTGDDKKTASGHFTAKVSLTAKFQTSPELTGTINDFEPAEGQGDGHVNRNWSLKLEEGTAFGAGTVGAGDYDSTSITGGWTAQAYGSGTSEEPKRPDGIFGGFNADFSDGKASGVYHAGTPPAE